MNALVVLAALLPFELVAPLFKAGPIGVTTVEAGLYALLASWVLLRSVERGVDIDLLQGALLGVITVTLASAAASGRPEAVKFALRAAGGCALALAASDLVNTAESARRVIRGVMAGAVLSAALGILEVVSPLAERALSVFKTQPSFVGGFLRASGPFQYANTAAMYWEAALGLALFATAAVAVSTQRRARRLASWCGLAIIAAALVLTASRAGVGTALLLCFATTWLARRRLPAVRTPLALCLVVLVVLSLTAPTPLLSLRLKNEDEAAWHRAAWTDTPATLAVGSGGWIRVPLTVRNTGLLTWPATGRRPVTVSYHWISEDGGRIVHYEGARTTLPRDVKPGEEARVLALVSAPLRPGRYLLQWDLARETVTWFSVSGGPSVLTRARVIAEPVVRSLPPPLRPILFVPEHRPPRLALWRAALTMWREAPWLGKGPDAFRFLYGPYIGRTRFDTRVTTNNSYLEILATLGLAGVVAFAILFVVLGRRAGIWWTGRPSGEALAIGLAVCAGLAAFLVHGLFDYFLEFTPTYALFWLLVGIAPGAWARPAHPTS